jgi:thiol-disulfide isomerase/thioredoxin
MRIFTFLALASLLITCSSNPTELKTGVWRGEVEMQDQKLPFGLEIQKTGDSYTAAVVNAGERITLDEMSVTGDSLRIVMHIFDSELRAKIEGDKLIGSFVKNYDLSATLPFVATYGDTYRFAKAEETAAVDFSGTYQLIFNTIGKPYPSVGIIKQNGNSVEGTFLTPTGDYRYLQGNVVGNELLLSTFDGNHSFVFKAHFEGDSIKGNFYSGKKSLEDWKGVRNENAVMPDAESLTYLKEGYKTLDFSFPDQSGKNISLTDERFKNKVVILQIFGTWCPNCMDETKFLAPWYDANKDRGVEILGLAYERKPDFEYASNRISIMKKKLNVNYDFVIAGVNDKEKAAETLPALNHIISFPTTIFIGKDGNVKHIHTGFSGPGTGIYYDQFKDRFNKIVNELLSEDLALRD